MPLTPLYEIPYQTLSDPPNGAALGEDIANAVEREVGVLWNEVVRIDVAAPYQARQTLATTATVTFSGIPTTLRSLTLRWTARGDAAFDVQTIRMRVNGSSAASYAYESLQGSGATQIAFGATGATSAVVGSVTSATAFAGVYASGEITFVGWDSPHTAWLGFTCGSQAQAAATVVTNHGGGTYGAAGPYTSISLFPVSGSFVAGSDFQLYGIRA